MPFLPAALLVTAKTMATSAYLPVVMNCLTPLMHEIDRPNCPARARRGW